jgi:hypothetical protein
MPSALLKNLQPPVRSSDCQEEASLGDIFILICQFFNASIRIHLLQICPQNTVSETCKIEYNKHILEVEQTHRCESNDGLQRTKDSFRKRDLKACVECLVLVKQDLRGASTSACQTVLHLGPPRSLSEIYLVCARMTGAYAAARSPVWKQALFKDRQVEGWMCGRKFLPGGGTN